MRELSFRIQDLRLGAIADRNETQGESEARRKTMRKLGDELSRVIAEYDALPPVLDENGIDEDGFGPEAREIPF